MRIEHHRSDGLVLHAESRAMLSESPELAFTTTKNDHDALIMMPLPKNSKFERDMKLALAMATSFEWFSNFILSHPPPFKTEHIMRIEKILAKLIYFSDEYFSPKDFDKRESERSYNPLDALETQHRVSKHFQVSGKRSTQLQPDFVRSPV